VVFINAGVTEIWEMPNTKIYFERDFWKSNTNLLGAIAVTQRFINQAEYACDNLIVNLTLDIALPLIHFTANAASKVALRVFT
jgi:short-subunit dehydrogenase involved in D-alanine esterification of teichoic acids